MRKDTRPANSRLQKTTTLLFIAWLAAMFSAHQRTVTETTSASASAREGWDLTAQKRPQVRLRADLVHTIHSHPWHVTVGRCRSFRGHPLLQRVPLSAQRAGFDFRRQGSGRCARIDCARRRESADIPLKAKDECDTRRLREFCSPTGLHHVGLALIGSMLTLEASTNSLRIAVG